MLSRVQTATSPIGLMHDASEFRAVQLIRARGVDRVLASAIFPRLIEHPENRTPDADELRWVGEILARRGFVKCDVAILAGSSWSSSHILELPPINDATAKSQIARVEVAREKKCTPMDIELGYWDLPQKGRSRESMVVSCDRKELKSMLGQYETAGLTPLGVEVPELTLTRAIPDADNHTGIVGVLNIGWGSSVAVIKNGDAVVYVRRIEHGIKDARDRLVEQYELPEEAAHRLLERMQTGELGEHERPARAVWSGLTRSMVDELDVAIGYVSHAYRAAGLGGILVAGYGACETELLSRIDSVLGMPVRSLIPEPLKAAGLNAGLCARLAIPLGLAARFDRP